LATIEATARVTAGATRVIIRLATAEAIASVTTRGN